MAQLRKEKSLHNLITSVIEAHEKLEKPEFANIATELEIRSILNKCTEVGNHFYKFIDTVVRGTFLNYMVGNLLIFSKQKHKNNRFYVLTYLFKNRRHYL